MNRETPEEGHADCTYLHSHTLFTRNNVKQEESCDGATTPRILSSGEGMLLLPESHGGRRAAHALCLNTMFHEGVSLSEEEEGVRRRGGGLREVMTFLF